MRGPALVAPAMTLAAKLKYSGMAFCYYVLLYHLVGARCIPASLWPTESTNRDDNDRLQDFFDGLWLVIADFLHPCPCPFSRVLACSRRK